MVSFTATDHARVAAGEISVTWRLWKYAHVRPGRVYSTGFGHVEIEDVRAVRVADVTDADAHEAGLPDAETLVDLARSHTGAGVTPVTLLYRVQFHVVAQPAPRAVLGVDELRKRLQGLDGASRLGPWTLQTLRLIEQSPATPARFLAQEAGRDRLDFKANVRKLKALGLTVSLGVGYELSEAGQAYLDSLTD